MPAHIDRSVCGPQVKGSQEDSSKAKEALFSKSGYARSHRSHHQTKGSLYKMAAKMRRTLSLEQPFLLYSLLLQVLYVFRQHSSSYANSSFKLNLLGWCVCVIGQSTYQWLCLSWFLWRDPETPETFCIPTAFRTYRVMLHAARITVSLSVCDRTSGPQWHCFLLQQILCVSLS